MSEPIRITPLSRVNLGKLIVAQLLKKFPSIYGIRRFITAGFEVLRVMTTKCTVFWVVTPCS
jgi:hypothetical protein